MAMYRYTTFRRPHLLDLIKAIYDPKEREREAWMTSTDVSKGCLQQMENKLSFSFHSNAPYARVVHVTKA